MPTQKAKVEIIDEDDIDVVSVQKANKDAGRKISLPTKKADFINVEVGHKVSVRRAEVDGQPAIIVMRLKLA